MEKKIFVLIIMGFIVLTLLGVTITGVVLNAGTNESIISSGINEILNKINQNSLYFSFISHSKYNSVELIIEGKSYYFIYKNSSVQLIDSNKKSDLTIKMSYNEFVSFVNGYRNNDKKAVMGILNKIPFGAKINLFFQCLGTDWCRKKII